MNNFKYIRNEYLISTSDIKTFLKDRMDWDLSSPIRQNLEKKKASTPLFVGSMYHYGMEDFHGYNKFGDPVLAAKAWYNAHTYEETPPYSWDEVQNIITMLEYYKEWAETYEIWETYWGFLDGIYKPFVEVSFAIEIPELGDMYPVPPELYSKVKKIKRGVYKLGDLDVVKKNKKYYIRRKVYYSGTIDRVVTLAGKNYLLDYKTASKIDTNKLDTDLQITAYLMFAEAYLGIPIEGMIFMQQSKKNLPHKPEPLKKGGISYAQNQNTTAQMYKDALIEAYGTLKETPAKNLQCLQHLEESEFVNSEGGGNKYIRYDIVTRSDIFLDQYERFLISIMGEMINPDILIYPHFTPESMRYSSFYQLKLAMLEGDNVEEILEMFYQQRPHRHEGEEPEFMQRLITQGQDQTYADFCAEIENEFQEKLPEEGEIIGF